MGLALNNSYFSERINLYIALAPIARLDHTDSKLLKLVATQEKIIKTVTVGVLHYYDWFPRGFIDNGLSSAFCSVALPICKLFIAAFADMDPSVD